MCPTTDSAERAAVTVASSEVAAFMEARRTPRVRATRKVEAVVQRLIAGEPPLDRARSLWVCGSYVRGALDVGDIDLLLDLDEPRDRGQQALESFYRRAHPYAEVVKALGCGGGSIVNLDVMPVFLPAPVPISPERPRTGIPEGHEVPSQPLLKHAVTGDPFDPQPKLLWVRGDTVEEVRARLAEIPENPDARRFERTTTVPLIDILLPLLGVETGFLLAAQMRAGNLGVDAVVLAQTTAPSEAEESLRRRYSPGSDRYLAAASALAYLKQGGVKLNRVQLVEGPVTSPSREPRVEVAFNVFLIYLLSSRWHDDGWRHLHVWPTRRGGQWLALDATVKRAEPARDLSRRLSSRDGTDSRHEAIRAALGMPPLAQS
jgi:hypothetical protein